MSAKDYSQIKESSTESSHSGIDYLKEPSQALYNTPYNKIITLQRTIGNRAILRLQGSTIRRDRDERELDSIVEEEPDNQAMSFLQDKPYKLEAKRIAESVTRQLSKKSQGSPLKKSPLSKRITPLSQPSSGLPTVQRLIEVESGPHR